MSRFVLSSVVIALVITLVIKLLNGWNGFVLEQFIEHFSLNFMFATVLGAVNVYFFTKLEEQVPWQKHPAARLGIGAVGSVLLTMFFLFLLNLFTVVVIYGRSWEYFVDNQKTFYYTIGLIFTLMVSLIYHLIYFFKVNKEGEVEKQRLKANMASAKFDALKNQLDPHFLFNSLNVLVSTIEENQEAAVRFTTSLSKIYRYILEQKNKQLVPLNEELKFGKLYSSLLLVRFEDGLEINFPKTSISDEVKIVPLGLQLALENAIKHNAASAAKPLNIEVKIEDDYLIVSNNLQVKNSLASSSGVGLTNLRERYSMVTKRVVNSDIEEGHFVLRLPIIDLEAANHQLTIENQRKEELNAKQRLTDLKIFYEKLVSSAVILGLLGALNYLTSDFPWIVFPAIGFGIGLIYQYMQATDHHLLLGKHWKRNKINKLINQSTLKSKTMQTDQNYQQRYQAAQERVNELRGFYSHLTTYILVNLGLLALNYYSNQFAYPWALFPLLGWGIGITSHALKTYRINIFLGKDWEERKLQQFMEEEKHQK